MPIATAMDGPRVIKIQPLHVPNAPPLVFPTIITQFEDKWTPNWRAESVYGRMDPFAFYGGTQRQLSLGFRVISDDEEEAKINMSRLQRLIQYQYPAFRPTKGAIATIKAPPYFTVDIMNVAQSTKPKGTRALQGFFSSPLIINPGFQDKTKPQYFDNAYSKILFSDIDVKIQMTVLHANNVGFYSAKSPNFAGGTAYPYSIGTNHVSATDGLSATQIGGGPLGVGQRVGQVGSQGSSNGAPGSRDRMLKSQIAAQKTVFESTGASTSADQQKKIMRAYTLAKKAAGGEPTDSQVAEQLGKLE